MSATWEARDIATGIVRRLADAGHTAYFAGGCVRDELLGLHPEDYDVATDAVPDQVRALFERTNEVGVSFGVMLVHVRNHTVEVATFRREGDYTDRRRPDTVHYADAPSDARRRDFTINALFLDPLAPPDPGDAAPPGVPPHPVDGRVIDYVSGLDDLRAGVIRAVGDPDRRLDEDDLRALRAVRFAARLGFRIDDATADAIRRHARELRGVSRERIGQEIRRMLSGKGRVEAVRLITDFDLARHVLRERPSWGASPDAAHTPTLANLEPEAGFIAALAAWAMDRAGHARPEIGADPEQWVAFARRVATRLRESLRLTNEEAVALQGALATLGRLESGWEERSVPERKRIAAAPPFADALRLLRAIDPERAGDVEADVHRLAATRSGLAPAPLLSGDDLVKAGVRPGPELGDLLRRLYDAQLADRISSQAEAEDLLRSLRSGR